MDGKKINNFIGRSRYHRHLIRATCMLGLFGISFVTPAVAGMFAVTPVRIYMAPKERATAITITNDGDEELVMQADLYEWKQKPGGEEELTLTEDLFLAPPIIKLAPKSHQVVRLAVMRPSMLEKQLTYRLIVREIPEAKPADNNIQVQFALAFSLPVFITPLAAKAKLDCTVERVAADAVKAVCENTGNAHKHLTSFQLNSIAGERFVEEDIGGGYILSGIKRSFELKRKDGKIPAGKAVLEVTFADGTTQKFDANIAN